ncbi:redoxin domain-containing protein [Micromonospora sp. Llam7]|uniref:TlpA family protein disulfide reductase n=1 Tax=Micromonospora tarapacensis TaxID=2835305 RepID=UPI001C830A9B|nr:redoxin domain-containing protein [Micromonospora tarapacensis]MBX7266487.1 redoxin domain-containing protein [Micromonospora tarapacensis]
MPLGEERRRSSAADGRPLASRSSTSAVLSRRTSPGRSDCDRVYRTTVRNQRMVARIAPAGTEHSMVARRLICLLAVAVLAVAGCGDNGGTSAGSADRPSGTATGSPLEFTATTVDGAPFDGRSLVGKPAVLWFWAPWCPVCLQQAPGVREAAEQHGDQVAIVGIAGLDEAAAMPEFIRLAKVGSITNLSDESGEVWKRFGITSQSTFVLIDAAGTVTFRGRLDADEVPDRVAELLG